MVRAASGTRAASQWVLWLCLLVGPAAWTAHLLLSYVLVPVACATGLILLLHLVTLLTALATLAAAGVAYLGWEWLSEGQRAGNNGSSGGSRFLAASAVLLNGIFLFVILVEGIPTFYLSPCG
jgi:hypothetical protein